MKFLLVMFFLVSLNLIAEENKPQEQSVNKASELDINNSFITKYEYFIWVARAYWSRIGRGCAVIWGQVDSRLVIFFAVAAAFLSKI